MNSMLIKTLELNCEVLRLSVIDVLIQSKDGHLGACMSSVELITVLYCSDLFRVNPRDSERDLILIRGHLGPLRYSLFAAMGWIDSELLSTYRKLGSPLQGHEDMNMVEGVDITPSGCLGNILGYGVGASIARSIEPKEGRKPKTIVFLGDGEEQEGVIGESARAAQNLDATNIICILDANGGQLTGKIDEIGGRTNIAELWKSYGWTVEEIDGHCLAEIYHALTRAKDFEGKVLVIAKTRKGNKIPGVERSENGYHTLSSLGSNSIERVDALRLARISLIKKFRLERSEFIIPEGAKLNGSLLDFRTNGERPSIQLSNREDKIFKGFLEQFDDVLCSLASSNRLGEVVVLNADTQRPDRRHRLSKTKNLLYLQLGIREQAMVCIAHGYAAARPRSLVFVDIGEPFVARCFDQIVAMAQARLNIVIAIFYPGLCGEGNGSTHQPSGMAVALASIPNVNFFEPINSVDFDSAIKHSASRSGPTVLRLHTLTKVTFPEGYLVQETNEFAYLRSELKIAGVSGQRRREKVVVIVSAGLVAFEAVKAAQTLEHRGIRCELLIVKRLTQLSFLNEFSGFPRSDLIISLYNGSPYSLDTVLLELLKNDKLKLCKIERRGFPTGQSGLLPELLDYYGLSANAIVDFCAQELS